MSSASITFWSWGLCELPLQIVSGVSAATSMFRAAEAGEHPMPSTVCEHWQISLWSHPHLHKPCKLQRVQIAPLVSSCFCRLIDLVNTLAIKMFGSVLLFSNTSICNKVSDLQPLLVIAETLISRSSLKAHLAHTMTCVDEQVDVRDYIEMIGLVS